jgi:hypothetical protein
MVFQQTPIQELGLADTTFAPIPIDSGASKWDLLLELWDAPDGIAGAVAFDLELFEPAFVRLVINGLTTVLQEAANDAGVSMQALDAALARTAEQHRKARAAVASSASRRLFHSARGKKPGEENP